MPKYELTDTRCITLLLPADVAGVDNTTFQYDPLLKIRNPDLIKVKYVTAYSSQTSRSLIIYNDMIDDNTPLAAFSLTTYGLYNSTSFNTSKEISKTTFRVCNTLGNVITPGVGPSSVTVSIMLEFYKKV